ncbi:putative phosphoesterase [Waddlia chondrophila WSU 86-1044]|uniref:Putative phosphoesterase n=2 Tax=Waddlia chondrophila TaxID=71667 RepID=D6YU98_WADCW|nr:putative phosphoesterase [Waddlia chondrophila WSU 86-1044]
MESQTMNFNIWAIGDLHLSFGVPNKGMEAFGETWSNWTERLKSNWISSIKPQDLVLLPGDISWATHLEDAIPDLEWIDKLPGTKVMIRGNHDYWWSSKSKVESILPSSLHIIQNNVFNFQGVAIAGARLWDTAEFNFNAFIDVKEGTPAKKLAAYEAEDEKNGKIYAKELIRLELSLKELRDHASHRLCMTHYPPLSASLADSRASRLLEKYGIQTCVFGHLHSLKKGVSLFGEKNGVNYALTSCDYLDFQPLKIY